MRPLRVLPPDLPDLRPLERGDGLAAWPHPADGEDGAGHAHVEPDRHGALRPLPRLHGVRHELSVGRALRPADRGDAGDGRGAGTKRPRAERLQRRLLFATLPYPGRMRWALRLAPLGRRLPSPAWARPMLDLAPRWRSSEQAAPLTPRAESHGSSRAHRAAHGLRAVGRLRRGERRDGEGARRRGPRGRRAAAGLLWRACPRMPGAQTSRRGSPAASGGASRVSTRSWSTPPAAART